MEMIHMGRKAGIELSNVQREQLTHFMNETKDKREYRAALGVLLRGDGKSAKEVGRQLGVTIKQVFMWCRKYHTKGIDGLRMKKQPGRPAIYGDKARKIVPELLKKDPQAFGYLKGRWVLRDIARELKKEGIDLHYTSVHRILSDLGIVLKSPKLRAPGSIRKNYRKRAEIRRYKRAASALLKKGSQ